MKESGIEKLIELYYEYELDLLKRDMRVNGATEREIEMADIEKVEEEELEKNLNKLSDLKPFIKWLVENEKIERNEKFYLEDDEGLFGTYECLLMQLAIQDEPINFLLEILK